MHQRLANEFVIRLARRALAIIAPSLREEEWRDAFEEFHMAFKEELLQYEQERERMAARLRGCAAPAKPTSESNAGQSAS